MRPLSRDVFSRREYLTHRARVREVGQTFVYLREQVQIIDARTKTSEISSLGWGGIAQRKTDPPQPELKAKKNKNKKKKKEKKKSRLPAKVTLTSSWRNKVQPLRHPLWLRSGDI